MFFEYKNNVIYLAR